jgi:AraC family transcriptional regulator of adaptative response / DNA-3-methyladenine glycosylase II
MELALEGDGERLYHAVVARDRRFEGRFVVAVRTTGVYCRPGCPAPIPARKNVRFFACAAAAEEAGFRACLRCRPDASPGSPAWNGASATVARGLGLIAGGAVDEGGVDGLAAKLGVGARHLRRLFARELGASPLALARTRRTHFARKLLEETGLSMAEVALSSGYTSVRRFNEEMRRVFRRTPRELRRGTHRSGAGVPPACFSPVVAPGPLTLRLAYKPPYDWPHLIAFLGARAIAGVEQIEGDVYRRLVDVEGSAGLLEVRPGEGDALALTLHASIGRGLLQIVERVVCLFDLRADPLVVASRLARSARLRPLVEKRPGLRVPGAFDPFETVVRAILGQQVSVAGASTLCARLVERFGRPVHRAPGLTHLFPSPAVLAGAELRPIGLPAARAETIRSFARAVADGRIDLRQGTPEPLLALPGIGPWTAAYVAMRAFGDPDAFPSSDLGLRKALASNGALPPAREVEAASEAFRPFRSYAAMHLWTELMNAGPERGG